MKLGARAPGGRAESLKPSSAHRRAEGGPVARRSRLGLLVVASLLLLEAVAPGAVALPPSTGAWIFPHANQAEVLLGQISDSFYTGEHGDPELNNSFYATAGSSSAAVQVDFYNPTASTIINVQVWAAITVNHSSYFNSMSFAGGVCGDLSYPDLDSLSAGTPVLSDLTPMDGHGVYPAYFASYCIGNLNAGAIKTIWVNVSGDFESGLIVHLDYSGEDAFSAPIQGPVEADMNIWKPPPEPEVPAEPSPEAEPERNKWANFGYATTEFGVQFFDASTPPEQAISWDWSFGDGYGSRKQNPAHIYPCKGTYLVSLVVLDVSGEEASVSVPVSVAEDRPSCGIFQRTEEGLVFDVEGAPLTVPTALLLFLFAFSLATLAFDGGKSSKGRPILSRQFRALLLVVSALMLLYTTGALAYMASQLQPLV